MSDWKLTKSGFDELRATFREMQDPHQFDAAVKESLKVLQQEASRIPPQPSRTRSKHFNTWVREVGALPRAAFGVSRKTGKVTIRRGGRAVLRVSEKLLQQWKTAVPQITYSAGQITGRIVNAASYGKWVQGEQQTRFHAVTGWKTTEQIEASQEARIRVIFERTVNAILRRAG